MTIHVITKQHENPVEFASTSREAADEHLATLGPGGFSIHAVECDDLYPAPPPDPITEPTPADAVPEKGVLHGKRQARPKT